MPVITRLARKNLDRRQRGALMRAIASWCVRHRRIVVAAWLVALVGLT